MSVSPSPIVRIVNSTFRRTSATGPLFKNLSFAIYPVTANRSERWSIVGPSSSGKSTLLQILQGKHQCDPSNGRSFPTLAAKNAWPDACIGLVEFTGTGGLGERVRGEYMSSRYESRREATDITLREWLRRTVEHLPMYTDNFDFSKAQSTKAAEVSLDKVADGLKLSAILDQPVSTLSNGQGRRARIAQALLRGADLVLLDEPFMGLDPPSTKLLSSLLYEISSEQKPDNALMSQVVLALRTQDPMPEWISHLVYVDQNEVVSMGPRQEVETSLRSKGIQFNGGKRKSGLLDKAYRSVGGREPQLDRSMDVDNSEILIDVQDVRIAYRGKEILKDFSWTIRKGDRWGLFGPNGSGKTTVLSLLTSDHPMSYSLPVVLFGRSRLPSLGQPGISIFDIQARIGHSSPEIHQFFPKYRTLRQCIESAYADTFLSKPDLTDGAVKSIDSILKYFNITSAQQKCPFGEQPLSLQRLALFLRAVVKKPDLVILDEAFSGMDVTMRTQCMKYLENGGLEDRQALVCVSHVEDEIPDFVNKFVRLQEAGTGGGPVFGER